MEVNRDDWKHILKFKAWAILWEEIHWEEINQNSNLSLVLTCSTQDRKTSHCCKTLADIVL